MQPSERVSGARIYRFHDAIALSWAGIADSNIYMTPPVAKAIASLLTTYANDCTDCKFTTSTLGTSRVTARGFVVDG